MGMLAFANQQLALFIIFECDCDVRTMNYLWYYLNVLVSLNHSCF